MRSRKGTIFAGVGMVLAIGLMGAVWIVAPEAFRFTSATGYVTKLEGYHFTTNRVEYRFPKRRFFEQWLPKGILRNYEHAATKRVFVKPKFADEPLLSAAFAVRVPKGKHGWAGRLVVADENGNEVDSMGDYAGNYGDNPTLLVLEARAFPRRGKKLKLKLKTGTETVAKFEIPNPARATYPQWRAKALPVSAVAGDLKVRLAEFVSERSKEDNGQSFPTTTCVFELVQRGEVTTNWFPRGAEFRDATGNRWQPEYRDVRYDQGRLEVAFLGALWEGEEGWIVQMDFQQRAEFADEELVRWEGLEVPLGREVVRPKMVHEARVELLGLFGPAADRDAAQKIFLNINPRPGTVTIAMKLGLMEFVAFSLVGIYDENNQPLEVVEMDRGPMTPEDERFVPLLVHFKPGAEVKRVSMVFALPKSKRVEFLAKPVQR
ncbi:MAG: hypothetical protein ACXW32_10790 [Limisphaerales bacterium]